MIQRIAAAALAVLLPCGSAVAGATLTMHAQRGDSILLLDGNKLRTEEIGGDQAGDVMIYDGDAQKMIIIDVKAKTYTEMTPAKLKAQISEANAQMKDSMAKMPAEQRAQMKAAMEKMDPETRKRMEAMMSGGSLQQVAGPKKTRFEKTGKQQTVAGYACEGFRQLTDNKVEMQGCFIPWSAAAVAKADMGSLTKMREFIHEGGQGLMDAAPFALLAEMPGFPGDWARVNKDGTESNKMSLTSIKRGSISADNFKVPAGYTENELEHGPKH